MEVFKIYFKIFKKRALLMTIIFLVIFTVILSIFGSNNESSENVFEVEKVKIAIIDRDKSDLSINLSEYIEEKCNYIELKDDEKVIKDALFFNEVSYVLIVPEGYEKDFIDLEKNSLQSIKKPTATNTFLMDEIINGYMDTVSIYKKSGLEIDYSAIKKDLSSEANVDFSDEKNTNDKPENSDGMNLVGVMNFSSYPILAILTFAISTIMIAFNDKEIIKRNNAAPIKSNKFSMQLLLGNLVITIIVYLVLMAVPFLMYFENPINSKSILLYVNTFIFTLMILCLSFLIGLVAKKSTISAISNSIALGSTFLGGAFIPQDFLSEFVKKISLFNPTFWYIKNNNFISEIGQFDGENIKKYVLNIFIQISFGILFISISLLINNKRKNMNKF
jgi:ABC-2 type transport system permease protein